MIYGFAAILDDLDVDLKNKVDKIVSYIMDERFQVIQDRYGILYKGNNSYVSMAWYPKAADLVNQYLDDNGTYNLPKEYLTEKDSVWIMGSHMSLGENRRSKKAYVVKGTFHMLKILRQTKGAILFWKTC